MTKFEQLVLRAHHAQLQILRMLTQSLGISSTYAHDVARDIEHELIHGATDERDETHG